MMTFPACGSQVAAMLLAMLRNLEG